MTTSTGHPEEEQAFRNVEIEREPVELYKVLKFEGMVNSGGQGKAAVAAGDVLVNGEVETQKRKKIVHGDTIEFNQEKIRITLATTEGSADESQ